MNEKHVFYGNLGYEGRVIAKAEGVTVTLLPAKKNRATVMGEWDDIDAFGPFPPRVEAYIRQCNQLIAGKTINEAARVVFPPL